MAESNQFEKLTARQEQEEEDKVVELSEPTKELATRILSQLSFEDRIEGIHMHPMTGSQTRFLFSFEEVAHFLDIDIVDLKTNFTSGFVNFIDLIRLKQWVEKVLGDRELADAIGEKIKNDEVLKNQIETVKPLLLYRLEQCKKITGENPVFEK